MSVVQDVADRLGLEALFDDRLLSFDLRQGIIFNPARSRVCLLSADLIGGVYNALLEEAGPAWRLILKGCGRLWGERLFRRLDNESLSLSGGRLRDLPLDRFLDFFLNYFASHGWGVLRIDTSLAESRGVVQATLEDSVCAAIINDPDDMADALFAGILGSLFSWISERDLDCMQTECISKGAAVSRFVITSPDRLEKLAADVKGGVGHEKVVARL